MKAIFFIVSIILLCFSGIAQETRTATVKGKVVDKGNIGIKGVVISLSNGNVLTATDENGNFIWKDVPYGNYEMLFNKDQIQRKKINIAVNQHLVDLESIELGELDISILEYAMEMPASFLVENYADYESSNNQSISATFLAARDPYLSAGFSLSPLGFQLRGYKRDQLELSMNGLLMNDIESGFVLSQQWSGLNEVFKNQTTISGISAAEKGFGGLMGTSIINSTAAYQRKQTSVEYSTSNAIYKNRLMLTHSTGMMENGWAVSIAASKSWAKEGYVPGTFYNGETFYFGLSKKINQKHFIHATTFGSQIEKGNFIAATKEAMDLADDRFYNPSWGWLNGEIRNARVQHSFQPIFILNYEYLHNPKTSFNVAASYQTGFEGYSNLDWYNTQDPRPDYYKNLPSYYLLDPNTPDPETAAAIVDKWRSDPEIRQVNWNKMYETNQLNYETVNGFSGNRSLYIIGEDRNDISKYNFSAQLDKSITEQFTIQTGLIFTHHSAERYKKLLDLLGGDYYVNLNQFAERAFIGNEDFKQNDLNNPNKIIQEGDQYGHHYIARFTKMKWWGQALFSYNKLDFFLSARIGLDAFQREGLYKNGLFQEDSYGKSEMKSFITYEVKGGWNYKINKGNYLFANGAYLTDAPVFDHVFFSPRTRNTTVKNSKLAQTFTFEGGYLLKTPKIDGRMTIFTTDIKDATRVLRYYDESYRTFVNFVMEQINIRHLGVELALQLKITPSFSLAAAATWMQVFYTSNSNINIYKDNDTGSVIGENTVFWENYYAASGPQSAYNLKLNYRSPKFWYASLNVNFVDRSYLEMNPSRLTKQAVDLVTEHSPEWHKIVDQEKLPAAYTVDLSAGKSFFLSKKFKWLPDRTSLFLNFGVNNILDNKSLIVGGFQQLRFDYSSGNPDHFPNKYIYGYGRNYFVRLGLNF